MRWRDAAVQGEAGLHLLPFGQLKESDRLALEQQMLRDPDWLARHLRELDLAPGTLALIDTPPGPTVYASQTLRCADLALVVTLSDAASYATLPQAESLIAQYAQGREGYLGHAFIVNQVDSASALAKDTLRVMRGVLGERLGGVVHRDAAVSEALAFGKTVIDHAPHSQACSDILASAQWLRRQLSDAKREHP